MARKIVDFEISGDGETLVVKDDEDTLWVLDEGEEEPEWTRLPKLPQDN